MSVRFVIGRAGTGKTKRALDAIVKLASEAPLGPPIFLLLPKQATFTAERILTCDRGLQAFMRIRVVSFEQLGEEILAECGGVAIPEVTAIGRRMVLGHLLRQNKDRLQYFRSVAHQTGLAVELDSIFSELERCGKSADDLATLAHELNDPSSAQADAALRAKLADLHLLYDAYARYLGQDRLDPHQRLMQVLRCVHDSKALREARVFVDSFYEFTDYERRFLAAVVKSAAEVEVNLTLDPQSPVLSNVHEQRDELGMFHPIEETYRRLWFAFSEADVQIGEHVILRMPLRFKSRAIEHVERCLFLERNKPARDGEGIELIESPDRRAEVDAAARTIQQLIADEHLRLRDIAVLVRDMESYHELINASFQEHGLPWFVDRRRGAAHHPLIQCTRALSPLATHNFDHDSLMTVLRSGLVMLGRTDVETRERVDELENYLLRHRIRGDAWIDERPWNFDRPNLARSREDENDVTAPGAAEQEITIESKRVEDYRRRLVTPLLPFITLLRQANTQATPLKQIVRALIDLFESFKIRDTLSRWIEADAQADQLEESAEHGQVWDGLISLLEQMVDLMGNEPMATADFVQILESGLESFDLALTPPTLDQVLVGSIVRTRTPAIRAAIVLGLNEGGFPLCDSEDAIFCDSERRTLSSHQIDLDPDTHRRLLDERFLAYIAFTRASERLIVTRPLADESGRPMAPSSFWNQLRAIFPALRPTVLPRDVDRRPDCIGTPRQLVTSLLRWVRADPQPAGDPIWPALYQRFARHECADDPIDLMRYRAWRTLSYANESRLATDLASRFYGDELRASVSRIETFAACPFKHFARYDLRLEPRDEEELTQLDLGNAYHKILENLVREMMKQRTDFASAPQQFTDQQIKLFAAQIGRELRHEVLLSTARNEYILRHVQRTLALVIASQREAARRGRFRPWHAELKFGDDSDERSLPAFQMQTPGGKSLRLRGTIDRVDLLEDESAFAVIDYKLSQNLLGFDRVYYGLSLQLLTYLLVLQANADSLGKGKLAPAAAFYVKLLRRLEWVKHPQDALVPTDPQFHLKDKPRGIFDRHYLDTLDDQFTGKSDVVHVTVRKDGGIAMNSDCVESDTFAALLLFVRRRIGELADRIVAGDVRVGPYRIGTLTPCPNCDYRSVCRFDPGLQGYRKLPPVKRDQVIAEALELRGGRQ